MGMKRWFGVVSILVIASGILGFKSHAKNISPHSNDILTKEQVISDIQKQQFLRNKSATHVHIIHLTDNARSEGFAFASFDVDGQRQYASLESSGNGYSMSTFTIGTDRRTPIQFVTLSGDGFEYITGGILNDPNVKSAVLVFSNGAAVVVPIEAGYFWYEHKFKTTTPNYLRQVFGITNTAGIIQDKTS
jgi:hypothetical protein